MNHSLTNHFPSSPSSPRTRILAQQRSRSIERTFTSQESYSESESESIASQEREQDEDEHQTVETDIYTPNRRYSFGSTTPTSPLFPNAPPSTPYSPRGEVVASPSSMAYWNPIADGDGNGNGKGKGRGWSWTRCFLAG
ncbi:hypothetical protein IFR05_005586, partial [Cadophora sp. M221]